MSERPRTNKVHSLRQLRRIHRLLVDAVTARLEIARLTNVEKIFVAVSDCPRLDILDAAISVHVDTAVNSQVSFVAVGMLIPNSIDCDRVGFQPYVEGIFCDNREIIQSSRTERRRGGCSASN